MISFYPDIWEHIATFLSDDDLFSLSLTCKSAYKAFRRTSIQNRICYPLLKPKKLTTEQREAIIKMERNPLPVKLVFGGVGSGKTIVALSYGLRNIFEKIFIVVPPSLIKMWWDTCRSHFGVEPLVLHSTNPQYRKNQIDSIPENFIILTSFKIFDHISLNYPDSLVIIDEVHHYVSLWNKQYRELIGLSATILKGHEISYGVFRLLDQMTYELRDIVTSLEKSIITSKLPEVVHIPPHQWKLSSSISDYILKKIYENDLRDMEFISKILAHPFIYTLEKNLETRVLGTTFKVGKKAFRHPYSEYQYLRNLVAGNYSREHEVEVNSKEVLKYLEEQDEIYLKELTSSSVKYQQCLAILLMLKKRKEKAIIFDNEVSYLPFLHKFLSDNGISSYMFTTHYDVTSRQRQLEKFKKDPKANVLLSSMRILGEGHNITEANHIIFLSNNLDSNKYYQAIGRCWRYPQNKQVYVHYLFNSELDKKIYEHAMDKTDLRKLDWRALLSQ